MESKLALTGEPELKIKHKANGYAYAPGSGPQGKTCKDCDWSVRSHHGQKYWWKCALMRDHWTNGYGTDIRLKSPACKFFTPVFYPEPVTKGAPQ